MLADISPDIAQRYQNLLNEIIFSTPTSNEAAANLSSDEAIAKMKKSNIFYIPSYIYLKTKDRSMSLDLNKYNSSIAMSYISQLAGIIYENDKLVERLTTKSGPFLISVPHPLYSYMITQGSFPLLYADLSNSNPGAIKEIVAAYKKYVVRERIDSLEEFKPLRLTLLNFFLNVDDDLIIARAAAKRIYRP